MFRRFGNPRLEIVFPGYTDYTPLGVVQGADLPTIYAADYHAYLPVVGR